MVILAIILSQLVFSFCRTLNVRYTANGNIIGSVSTSTLVKISWLLGSALGLKAITDLDPWGASAYVVSGVIGDYLSMLVKISKKR